MGHPVALHLFFGFAVNAGVHGDHAGGEDHRPEQQNDEDVVHRWDSLVGSKAPGFGVASGGVIGVVTDRDMGSTEIGNFGNGRAEAP
jgi:hypothetical protein